MAGPTSPRRTQVFSSDYGLAVDISSADHVFPQGCRALYVGGAGNVVVKFIGDEGRTSVTLTGVPAGTLLPIALYSVVRTSTTASAMVALF